MNKFKKTKSKEEIVRERSDRRQKAQEAFDKWRKDGKWVACQLLPPSMFMKSCRIIIPVIDANDIYTVAEACAQCPLREECEILGQDEPNGIWGGVARTNWSYWRRVYAGEFPYF